VCSRPSLREKSGVGDSVLGRAHGYSIGEAGIKDWEFADHFSSVDHPNTFLVHEEFELAADQKKDRVPARLSLQVEILACF
jgi:hypothetical protein